MSDNLVRGSTVPHEMKREREREYREEEMTPALSERSEEETREERLWEGEEGPALFLPCILPFSGPDKRPRRAVHFFSHA